MKHPLPHLIRLIVAVLLLGIGWRFSTDFHFVADRLGTMGMPLPSIALGLAAVTAWGAGIAFLLHVTSPLPILAVLFLCLPTAGLLGATYTGSAVGDMSALIQMLRLVEIPVLTAGVIFLLIGIREPGPKDGPAKQGRLRNRIRATVRSHRAAASGADSGRKAARCPSKPSAR